jgi:hypothetical protein
LGAEATAPAADWTWFVTGATVCWTAVWVVVAAFVTVVAAVCSVDETTVWAAWVTWSVAPLEPVTPVTSSAQVAAGPAISAAAARLVVITANCARTCLFGSMDLLSTW